MTPPVEKDFCDERSGNILNSTSDIKDDLAQLKKAVDRITWLMITTLLSVCGSLIVLLYSKCVEPCLSSLIRYLG